MVKSKSMNKKHNERCRKCKETIHRLLLGIFGEVEVNYDIGLPSRVEDYSDTHAYADIVSVYQALQKYRGFDVFVKTNKLPRVDFFVPSKKIIVEFDESQHFTQPREIALSCYRKHSLFGFSVDRWRKLCQCLDKRDNDPPYRDEQRAWYDTLRDYAPLLWQAGKTIRLYSRDLVWCSFDPINYSDLEKFKTILFKHAKEI